MLAILENNTYSLYDNNNVMLGEIKKESKNNFNECEIIIGEKSYKIVREKWAAKVFEGTEVVYNLKINSFLGSAEILETNKKIKGVWGLKWGTQLVDKENKTQLKIRHEDQISDTGKYVIEVSNDKTPVIDVLLALYGHLYGSKTKQIAVFITTIVIASIIFRSM